MSFKRITCNDLKPIMADDSSLLIDIRDANSFNLGHIDGAMHIDSVNMDKLNSSEDKSFPIVICCYHGHSSQSAARFFSDKGFTNVHSLDGGYAAWSLANK